MGITLIPPPSPHPTSEASQVQIHEIWKKRGKERAHGHRGRPQLDFYATCAPQTALLSKPENHVGQFPIDRHAMHMWLLQHRATTKSAGVWRLVTPEVRNAVR